MHYNFGQMYSKDQPFLATLLERYPLSKEGADKQTYHVSIDISGSGIEYAVGDSFGFYPTNPVEDVVSLIQLFHATGKELVADRRGVEWSFEEFLLKGANLADVTKKLFDRVVQDESLLQLSKEELSSYLKERHLLDFLQEVGLNGLTPQEFAPLLQPMMPRFYSVASSQSVVGSQVHFIVADVEYVTNGRKRHGVGSLQLCHRLPLNSPVVPLFHQPSHAFSLVEDLSVPIIMVGPGTGVAPFRAFMQERDIKGATGKNWLFFGERYEKENFYYSQEWQRLVKQNKLRLSLAFSRDQEEKIYVQDRMRQEAKELYSWLEKGAYFYVCGDAKEMAKAVEQTLLEILQQEGHLSHESAKDYLKNLRKEKRYLRDVY